MDANGNELVNLPPGSGSDESDEELYGSPPGKSPAGPTSAERLAIAAELGDLRSPEYMDGTIKRTDPELHRQITARIAELTEQSLSGGDKLDPLERVMSDGLSDQEARRNETLDTLEKEWGYRKADLPPDLRPFEAHALICDVLLDEDNFAEAESFLRSGLEDVPRNREAEALFEQYRMARAGPSKREIGKRLLIEILSDLQTKWGLSRNAKGGKK